MEINKKIAVVSIGLAIALALVPIGSVIGAQIARSGTAACVSPLYKTRLKPENKEYAASYVGKDQNEQIKLPKINRINSMIDKILDKLGTTNYNKLMKLVRKFKGDANFIQYALQKAQDNPALSQLQQILNMKNYEDKLSGLLGGGPPVTSWQGCNILVLLLIIVLAFVFWPGAIVTALIALATMFLGCA